MPWGIYLLLLMLYLLSVLCFMTRGDIKGWKRRIYRYGLGISFALIEALLLYARNPYGDRFGGGLEHMNAYSNSIVNVLYGAPYDIYATSIYGHYGLLYYPFVKLLTICGVNQWSAITAVIAAVGLVTFLAEVWILEQTIRNDILYTVAILANGVASVRVYWGEYYQVNPHRWLFPTLILGVSLWCQKMDVNRGKRAKPWIWGLCGLAILWNVETGMICLATWCVASIVMDVKWGSGNSRQLVCKSCVINALRAGMSFLCAYLLVNIYNLACGGSWNSLRLFIYPMMSDEYSVANLALPLGDPYHGWYLAIVIFMGACCYSSSRIIVGEQEQGHSLLLYGSIMGLGVMVYAINRSVPVNLVIIKFEFVLVLVSLLDQHVDMLKEGGAGRAFPWKAGKVLYVTGVLIVSSMSMATLGGVGERIESWHTTVANRDFEGGAMGDLYEINQLLPGESEIIILGSYAAVIASMMDRDPGIHVMDFEDMNPQGLAYIEQYLRDNRPQYVLHTDREGKLEFSGYHRIDEQEPYQSLFEDNLLELYQIDP